MVQRCTQFLSCSTCPPLKLLCAQLQNKGWVHAVIFSRTMFHRTSGLTSISDQKTPHDDIYQRPVRILLLKYTELIN